MLQLFRKSLALRSFALRPLSSTTILRYNLHFVDNMAPKRKRNIASTAVNGTPGPQTNPQVNPEIVDAPDALRASPDSEVDERIAPGPVKDERGSESPLSDVPDIAVEPPKKKRNTNKPAARKDSTAATNGDAKVVPKTVTPKKTPVKSESGEMGDPEAEGEEEADEEEVMEASSRPPPVHSDYLPLPWKGRLGYVSSIESVLQVRS